MITNRNSFDQYDNVYDPSSHSSEEYDYMDNYSEEIETDSPYQSAIDYIYSAIDSLGAVASSDELAQQAIADLSVVILELM